MIRTLTDEDRMIAEVAGELFEGHPRIPKDDEPRARYDTATWRPAADVGLASLGMPAEVDGIEGFAALGEVLIGAGRALSPLPILGSVVTVQQLIALAVRDEQRVGLLTDLVSGVSIGTLVAGHRGNAVRVEGPADQPRLRGSVDAVLDAASADLVLVTAAGPAGVVLYRVEPRDAGFTAKRTRSVDLTREYTRVELDDCPAQPVSTEDLDAALRRVEDLATVARACEQLGAARRCLEMTTQYVAERIQFGRPLGSFQAVKHQCADLAVAIDDAESAVVHAVWAADSSPEGLPLAAAMAGAVCSRVAYRAADTAVHLHGGIGFTWEHPAHLYFRRAVTDTAVYGDEAHFQERFLDASGVRLQLDDAVPSPHRSSQEQGVTP
ncbi:acyl-CoA dehydrogenase [Gordonia jinghuaiqii]|uniref:Acyl-CoA/acyl-ACP dehydrogenase n=1 Tax=Gordonia jinghuaiqii TaxID=2758710 RepID=A0A7D7LQH1_9ACTN|nr:acyl-CoA dehydrogenase family protein [Gordonia jinghuaiqii]MCR5979807.1 acyl-CoA dehydrogenase [Gordonia jinghuaiqii]QMT00805.1 acyl-CoA/acyl-ACP dehydrogenase [Gordonia jinghuaiqii]